MAARCRTRCTVLSFRIAPSTGSFRRGRVVVEYTTITGTYADGLTYELRTPRYRLTGLSYGAPAEDIRMSPRVAPAIPGLGLLEALSAQTILAMVDEQDADQDGISGRPNWVWDITGARKALGRFGWKAGQPSIKQQNAAALAQDMGITSSVFPQENTGRDQALAGPVISGGFPEISDASLDKLTFYVQALAIPARRDVDDPENVRGARLFNDIGCAACHRSNLRTGVHATVGELSNQTIHPYTDLLLHDMGSELADHTNEFDATGSEWRTAPLWGIGLTRTVSNHAFFLHDGRARTLAEAILWHGGEADTARQAFKNLSAADRAALISFLESL